MKKIHIIWSHPRTDSLTAEIVRIIKTEAADNRFETSELDLYRSEFSPVLLRADEPDWNDPDKVYSDDIMELAGSLNGKDAIIFVFPVWWYSVPAILKGYFDRVWNYGLIYGAGRKLPLDTIRWVALVGDTKKSFEIRDNDKYIEHYLNKSIASYCGGTDSKVEFLYDTLGSEAEKTGVENHYNALKEQARNVVRMLA